MYSDYLHAQCANVGCVITGIFLLLCHVTGEGIQSRIFQTKTYMLPHLFLNMLGTTDPTVDFSVSHSVV